MANAMGKFHQSVLGSVTGWEDHDAGYDLECSDRRIVAEVKNKWNTMNSANRTAVETGLETAVKQKGRPWTAYLVLIVPKTPERYRSQLANRVFETDGASFYGLVTRDPNALHDLFDRLCESLAPSPGIADHCRSVLRSSLPPREHG